MGFFSTLFKWFSADPTGHVPVITDEQVVDIKRLYATGGYTQKELGAMFGVNQSQISRILRDNRH